MHPQTRKHNGAIAQLVEQRTENPCVPGSIPGGTTPPFIWGSSRERLPFFIYNLEVIYHHCITTPTHTQGALKYNSTLLLSLTMKCQSDIGSTIAMGWKWCGFLPDFITFVRHHIAQWFWVTHWFYLCQGPKKATCQAKKGHSQSLKKSEKTTLLPFVFWYPAFIFWQLTEYLHDTIITNIKDDTYRKAYET